jgi:hypothetical protein
VIGKAPLHCCEVALPVLPEQAHHHIVQRSHHLRSAAPPQLAGAFPATEWLSTRPSYAEEGVSRADDWLPAESIGDDVGSLSGPCHPEDVR